MTNEELAAAIEKAHELLRRWAKNDPTFALLEKHLEMLLLIQRNRAAATVSGVTK